MPIIRVKPVNVWPRRGASPCSGGIWQDLAAGIVYHEMSRCGLRDNLLPTRQAAKTIRSLV
jgi:hypothetical protein